MRGLYVSPANAGLHRALVAATKAFREAHDNNRPFTPAKWKDNREPNRVVSWWVTEDKDGYFHAVLLGVAKDKDGDYIVEWSPDHGWCGLSGDRGAPLFP